MIRTRIGAVYTQLLRHPGYLYPLPILALASSRCKDAPLRQKVALDTLICFRDLHEALGIRVFLVGGLLLGAIRQGSFAGRPGDLDVAVDIPMHVASYAALLHELPIPGLRRIEWPTRRGRTDQLKIRSRLTVDVHIIESAQREMARLTGECIGKIADGSRDLDVHLPLQSSPSHIYADLLGEKFLVPNNYHDMLNVQYGAAWEMPKGPQFGVRQPNLEEGPWPPLGEGADS